MSLQFARAEDSSSSTNPCLRCRLVASFGYESRPIEGLFRGRDVESWIFVKEVDRLQSHFDDFARHNLDIEDQCEYYNTQTE
jgi:hypothetical protein